MRILALNLTMDPIGRSVTVLPNRSRTTHSPMLARTCSKVRTEGASEYTDQTRGARACSGVVCCRPWRTGVNGDLPVLSNVNAFEAVYTATQKLLRANADLEARVFTESELSNVKA